MKGFPIHDLTESEQIAWSAVFIVMGILVMVLNTLTLSTFLITPTLRARKHVLIINLTVTDLLFGAAGMTSAVVYILKPLQFSFSLWHTLNRFTKLVSLYTIGVIAVERMHATVFPLRHILLPNKVYIIALVFIWNMAALSTTVIVFFVSGVWDHVLISYGLQLTVGLAAIFIVISCYIVIWISIQRRNRRMARVCTNQHKALAVTLSFVTGGFLLTWFPPTLYLSITRICHTCLQPDNTKAGFVVLLLLGVQSLLNPIIYCFRISGFRNNLVALLKKMISLEMCTGSGKLKLRQATVHPEIRMATLT